MTDKKFTIGDRVSVDDTKYPGVWIIRAQGPVNSTLEPVAGGRRLRAPHYMLVEPVEPRTVAGANGATVTIVPTLESYVMGELVRVLRGPHSGLYVVIADKGEKVNLAKLGGDDDRYLRMPKSRSIERVALDEVLK